MWWDKRQEYYDEPWGGNEDLHNDGCLSMFFWLVVSGIVCFFLGSCKTYIPVPEYHNVYVEKHDTLVTRDSIYQKDSVYMWMQGDTIWKEKFSVLYKDKWRDKIVYRDSIRVDSIRVPMPVYVKKNLNFFERIEIYAGRVILLILIIVAGFYLFKYIRRRGI